MAIYTGMREGELAGLRHVVRLDDVRVARLPSR
jgi:hypothetical protein